MRRRNQPVTAIDVAPKGPSSPLGMLTRSPRVESTSPPFGAYHDWLRDKLWDFSTDFLSNLETRLLTHANDQGTSRSSRSRSSFEQCREKQYLATDSEAALVD